MNQRQPKALQSQTRHLHVPVSPEFLTDLNVTAARRGLSVKDYVTATLAADMKGGKQNGSKTMRPTDRATLPLPGRR